MHVRKMKMHWGKPSSVGGAARGVVGMRCSHAEVSQPVHKVKAAFLGWAGWLRRGPCGWSRAGRPGRSYEVGGVPSGFESPGDAWLLSQVLRCELLGWVLRSDAI